MRDYKEIEVMETYAKYMHIMLILAAVVVFAIAVGSSPIIAAIAALLIYSIGYMGICVLRIFAGIARDIRDMRNGQTGQRDGGK